MWEVVENWLLSDIYVVCVPINVDVNCMLYTCPFSDHYASNMAGLLLLVFFDVFSLPFLAVTSASLYSKITKEETQGNSNMHNFI